MDTAKAFFMRNDFNCDCPIGTGIGSIHYDVCNAQYAADKANLVITPLLEELANYKSRLARTRCRNCDEDTLTHDGIKLLDELTRVKAALEKVEFQDRSRGYPTGGEWMKLVDECKQAVAGEKIERGGE